MINRKPSRIQKELKRVSELITENRELMIKYPDEIGLEIDQISLENRKIDLLKEFQESNEKFNIPVFDLNLYHENGKNITFKAVSKVSGIFQDLVTSLVQAKKGPVKKGSKASDFIKDISRLEFLEASPGSLKILLSGADNASVTDSPTKIALEKLNNLLESGNNKELIQIQSDKLGGHPIYKYKEFLGAIYENDLNLSLYEKYTPTNFKPKNITKEFAESVYEIIVETQTPSEEIIEIEGVLGVINTFKHTFTLQKSKNDKQFTVKFDKDLTPIVKKRLEMTVKIEVKITKNYHELEDMDTDEIKKLIRFVN